MPAALHRLSVAVAVFIFTVPVCGQLWQPQDAEGRAYLYRDAQKALDRKLYDACDASTAKNLLEHPQYFGEDGLQDERENVKLWDNNALYADEIRAILHEGAVPDGYRDSLNGGTALMRASATGHTDAVRILLDNGADPNLQSAWGSTALMMACGNNHTAVVDLLLRNLKWVVNTNAQDMHGSTALFAATGKGNTEVVRMLLNHNADPADPNLLYLYHDRKLGPTSLTALDLAQRHPRFLWEESQNRKHAIAALLLEHGAQNASSLSR